jgi:carbon monoxide dehydrogenase subunit G
MLRWAVDVNVSGRIASLGVHLIQGTANKLAGKFFDCISKKLEALAALPLTAEPGSGSAT